MAKPSKKKPKERGETDRTEDAILKRLLSTPPQPHKPTAKKPPKKKAAKRKTKGKEPG